MITVISWRRRSPSRRSMIRAAFTGGATARKARALAACATRRCRARDRGQLDGRLPAPCQCRPRRRLPSAGRPARPDPFAGDRDASPRTCGVCNFDRGTVLVGDGVVVDAAAGPVASAYRAGWRGRDGPCWRAGCGGCEAERAVRPMAVLVLSELAQHAVQVTAVGDQQPVEALPSDAADESLSDRVCLRRPDRRADHTDALGA